MRWLCMVPSSLLLCGLLFAACSTGDPDCGCVVERGSERRSVACGQSACVAGRVESCSKTAEIIERGTCSNTANDTDALDAGTTPGDTDTTPDQRCQDLLTYCGASCTGPATVSADCQSTASAGDGDTCEQWPLVNSVLCHP